MVQASAMAAQLSAVAEEVAAEGEDGEEETVPLYQGRLAARVARGRPSVAPPRATAVQVRRTPTRAVLAH